MRRMVVLLIVVIGPAVRAADWPQFLGPMRNGHSPETGLLQAFPKDGPELLWRKKVGEGYSAPVVAGGKVFLFHRVGDDDTLDCLDAATGKGVWSFRYRTQYVDPLAKGNGPRSTPVVTEKHVYILAADGRLHCLDRTTGKQVWLNALHESYTVPESFFGVGTSPLVEGNRIFINVGGKGSGIVALDRFTGKEAWRALTDEASYSSPVAATIGGQRRLVFFTRTGMVIVDPADGTVTHQQRWRARIAASVNAATPLVVGDEVFLSSSYDTGATVIQVGKQGLNTLWAGDESLSSHFGTPVVHDGHLYGFHGRQEQGTEFRCVEWKTGKVKWSKPGFGCGSLIVADGVLIVMSEAGELVLVDPNPAGYREKARAEVLNGPVRSHMALADGRLFARDGEQLICLNMKK